MFLKTIHIENYRLLNDVTISLDPSLTLFVGKNNTGKTSIMQVIELLLSKADFLPFDDYPLECRKTLYSAIVNYWKSKSEDPITEFQQAVPITKVALTIDYSDDNMGNVSSFVIDLDEDINEAVIQVTFVVSPRIGEVLETCKRQFDNLIKDESTVPAKDKCLQSLVRRLFPEFFIINIVAVNPANPKDTLAKTKSDLQNLFCLKVIHAERNMDETEAPNSNPLGRIMRALFSSELEEMHNDVQNSMFAIQNLINESNYSLQGKIDEHMSTIVKTMAPFGYPDVDDMQLYAKTNIDLERSIRDETKLTYVSGDDAEALPSTHNGLGYKNLIKISLELHEFARTLKNDRTKLPLLFLEEPEAHMHPQLQTSFASFIEDFLTTTVGKRVVQIMMSTHSAHVANTVDFNKVRYIRRYANYVECKPLADFPKTGTAAEQAEHLDFLQKYMKLSYCDLYFCDKAILVEGASERLLLPDMIRKCKEEGCFTGAGIPLTSQYFTIIEVGGAYAHHFYDFVDYLGIPTLILTDIDFVEGTHNSACNRDKAERSSNGAINRWCKKVLRLEDNEPVLINQIINLSEGQRTDGLRHIEFEQEENGFHPRSLEDAIMNCNRILFEIEEGTDPNFKIKKEKKTDFALKLLVEHKFTGYQVPSYIKSGLIWLNGQPRT